MTHPDSCYRLVVAGPPSRLLVDTIDARFGSAASVGPSGRDTAVLLTADQSSLRALLTLLWDVGHELVTVSAGPDQQEPDPKPSPAGPLGRTRPSPR
jgi:hypothetical protein